MREYLKPYKNEDRLNYLCIAATHFLGERSLERMPLYLSELESLYAAMDPIAVRALRNIRLSGFAPVTRRELVLMIDAYRNRHHRRERRRDSGDTEDAGFPQRFRIDDDLTVTPRFNHLVPEDIREARDMLSAPLTIRERRPEPAHDPSRAAEIDHYRGYQAHVEPLGFTPPKRPFYAVDRPTQPPGFIPWDDLVAIAHDFDTIDVAAGRQQPDDHTWFHRLHDRIGQPSAILLEPGTNGLVPAPGIDLRDLKHLIGLPGAGKTTILYLLATWMARNSRRACFLFPSIEVASGFLNQLQQYEVRVGLLLGQGETSRTRHVLNFATALAPHNHGFGVGHPMAPFFATNCALAGFTSDEDVDFPHFVPPCLTLMQASGDNTRQRRHCCALASVCGNQHAERTLIDAPIWAGHVLSLDRNVSRVFSEFDARHFEYIAKTFDLLVIDECDGAQANLDARGTPLLKLSGDYESLANTILRDIQQPIAVGRNAFVAGATLPNLLEMTGRFVSATNRLISRVAHLPKKPQKDNANLLHTSLSLITDIYASATDGEAESQHQMRKRQAFERVWDLAAKHVAFRNQPIDDEEDEGEGIEERERIIQEVAQLAEVDPQEVNALHEELLAAIERWERDGNEDAVRELARLLRGPLGLRAAHDQERLFAYAGLLVTVSLVVLQYFGLAPHLRLLSNDGLLSENVFESRASAAQLAILPESLVGRMSGIRYTVSDEGDVDVTHVGFTGTPRRLPQRILEMSREDGGNGMAVLLTSATSMLENSPSFHIHSGPHYLLRRPNAGTGWERSRYHCLPMRDPRDATKALRFSGAPLARRDQIMRTMVDQLLKDGELGEVASAIADNDVSEGTTRKAAFIVNSYEQAKLVYEHIVQNHPFWRNRVRYLVRAVIHGRLDDNAVTVAEVEQLGNVPGWDLFVFPMGAIGRGINIVFRDGPRKDHAMLGSLFFLTRPHPRGESLDLIQGMVGRASEEFDRRRFPSLEAALAGLARARRETLNMAKTLLRMPLVTQRLGDYAEPFVANQMIMILQTIGRAMRGDCPAYVYFVDAAWAPDSAAGKTDNERSSMLVMMQTILQRCLDHPDPAIRECYQDLYQPFAVPLRGINNLSVE
jgi:hypothetical protein